MYIWVQKFSGTPLSPITNFAAQKTAITKIIGQVLHHEVNACDSDTADLVEANMINADQNFDLTLGALQKNYKCLFYNDATPCTSVGAFVDT